MTTTSDNWSHWAINLKAIKPSGKPSRIPESPLDVARLLCTDERIFQDRVYRSRVPGTHYTRKWTPFASKYTPGSDVTIQGQFNPETEYYAYDPPMSGPAAKEYIVNTAHALFAKHGVELVSVNNHTAKKHPGDDRAPGARIDFLIPKNTFESAEGKAKLCMIFINEASKAATAAIGK